MFYELISVVIWTYFSEEIGQIEIRPEYCLCKIILEKKKTLKATRKDGLEKKHML